MPVHYEKQSDRFIETIIIFSVLIVNFHAMKLSRRAKFC